ncbi:helix-turn-helix domain-containing protein [Streptomyces phaeochromogenes]|uniref:helix-turn-helix domain-containing protein n=1 Tax=Streptomyces phaeochromogenes TaxID=1923 RepID=UPI0037184410
MESTDAAQALARLRRQLRERAGTAGLTTTTLSARTNLGRTTVSNALNDRPDRPSWNTVAALAKALRFSQEEIAAMHELWERTDPKRSDAPIPADLPEPAPPSQRQRRAWLVGAAAVAVVAAVSVPVWLSGAAGTDDKNPSSGKQKSPAASSAPGPLLMTSKWPTLKTCDGVTAVAMPDGGKPLTDFVVKAQDFRTAVTTTKNKGGSWGAGHLYVNLSTKDDTTVTIDEIHLSTRIPTRIAAPNWVALTQGGCGDVQERVFTLDLDKPRLVDRGVQGELVPGDKPAPTNPLGSGFTVSAKDPAIIRVDATACRGNYEWSLVVDYSHDGKQLHRTLGPFKTFGVAGTKTQTYVPNLSTGKIGEPLPEAGFPSGCPATS